MILNVQRNHNTYFPNLVECERRKQFSPNWLEVPTSSPGQRGAFSGDLLDQKSTLFPVGGGGGQGAWLQMPTALDTGIAFLGIR